MPAALAYFITFRTYGTWIPGDPRGTADFGHTTFGEPHAPRDDFLSAYARRRMSGQAATLSEAMRVAVAETVERTCQERDWRLLALNVRTNHVHVVVVANVPPEFVMNRLKSSSTATLRARHLAQAEGRVWARHGSTKYLWTDDQVAGACDYTMNRQD